MDTIIALEELRAKLEDIDNQISAVGGNISGIWQGPAAASYEEIFAQNFDFSRLLTLVGELECEVRTAAEALTDN